MRPDSRLQNGQPQMALESYKDVMVASGVTPVRPQDNDAFTRLTRNDSGDDWLKRGDPQRCRGSLSPAGFECHPNMISGDPAAPVAIPILKAHTTMLCMWMRRLPTDACSSAPTGQYGCQQLLNEQRRQLFAKLGTCGEIACNQR